MPSEKKVNTLSYLLIVMYLEKMRREINQGRVKMMRDMFTWPTKFGRSKSVHDWSDVRILSMCMCSSQFDPIELCGRQRCRFLLLKLMYMRSLNGNQKNNEENLSCELLNFAQFTIAIRLTQRYKFSQSHHA